MTEAEFREFLDGVHAIGDVAEAVAIVARAEAALAALEPFNAILTPVVLSLNVLHALDAKYIAYGCAGSSYGLVNGATGQGSTDYPAGGYSIEDEETIAQKKKYWAVGVADAQTKLADEQRGTALRNKILLKIAQNGGNPEAGLQEIWCDLCREFDIENPYAEQMCLLWPATGITAKA